MYLKVGICKGTSEKARGDFMEYYVLVSNEEQDQFGQLVEVTTGIRISKAQLESGIRAVYDNLKGKQVCVPIFTQAWKSKAGNVGKDDWLSRDGKPVPLVRASAAAAAAPGSAGSSPASSAAAKAF